MKELHEDYEKRMMEKINQEAEEIQRALDDCPQLKGIQPSEELDQKVYAGIEAYDASVAKRKAREKAMSQTADSENETADETLASLSEEDQEALRLGRELQMRRKEEESKKANRRKAGVWKRIAAAVAVVVMVAGVGVNSIGGPERVVEILTENVGDREVSKVNSSVDDTKVAKDMEEEQAYQQVEEELGIKPVRLVYIPEKINYKYCEIDSDIRVAQIIYDYNNKNISYIISSSYTEELWGTDIEDKKTDEYTDEIQKEKLGVTEYELPESGEKEYVAEFEYQEVYYQLTAVMDRGEFEKILNDLHFPS